MKIVFLDFDGVLNSRKYFNSLANKEEDERLVLVTTDQQLDPKAVELVNQLVERTGAQVVISSSWRILHALDEETNTGKIERPSLNTILKNAGARFKAVGTTPRTYEDRGIEIQLYLDYLKSKGEEVEAFVILDDDSDMAHFLNTKHFVKTAFEYGFTEFHLEEAIKALN